ncbi:hypothetical protein FP371_24415 [Citrobacter freundii]|uniref:hypothetical protein n=1 Tax=Gammaproteobacteria TaxID=1236 RepID=UPI000695D5C1|nr:MULTISPECIES: hypothetical protein [Gammaproteobacteria]EEA2350430.1 hypothetical protein [Salmonella enterica subsp. enterica serovar Enteritidis]EEC4304208.1 hypothetical protein [Salmonella enterica subsp. enterica serovar Enteritidis]EEN2406632.1 hypothetical protein [Salmonella enterica subsp. enterica serovar Enteritidis]EES8921248.1 hypothetical protein [Escherichia coli]EES9862656.1 hypothetical protein [Escherichia coli]
MKPEVEQRDTSLYHDQVPDRVRYRPSRRGELNSLRKGQSKIHRRYKPAYTQGHPKGTAGRVFAAIQHHDWNRNRALIDLRRKGYTPYSRQFDPDFSPKPRRIGIRSESREALTALHFSLAANCDYNPSNEYPFELMVPFEEVAKQMGVLHRYENGRVAYDVAYHALRVTEEIGQAIVVRGWDKDTRQHKPLRIFLTTEFFTSKGISLDELKHMLCRFQTWARKNGLSKSLKQRYEQHLLRLARLNLGIDKHYSLKKLLKRIKWKVTSPELLEEKQKIVDEMNGQLSRLAPVAPLTTSTAKSRWYAWVNSGAVPTYQILSIESSVSREYPQLRQQDEEQFYRRLLERSGVKPD